MDCLRFQSLIGIIKSVVKKLTSKRHCIHGYSFQSLIGIVKTSQQSQVWRLLPLNVYYRKRGYLRLSFMQCTLHKRKYYRKKAY